MFYYFLTTLYVFACFVLLLVILLQQGKGGDMASAFGGGSSQTAFGARGGATLLTKLTAGFSVVFMLTALALAILGQRGPGSIMSGTAPPPPVSTPSPAKPMRTSAHACASGSARTRPTAAASSTSAASSRTTSATSLPSLTWTAPLTAAPASRSGALLI